MKEYNFIRILGRFIKFAYYDIAGIEVIHCIGDSHAGTFNYYRVNKIFYRTVFKVFAVSGATALGITNIHSTSKARELFNRYLKFVRKNHTLLISLGEVDCDFLLWLKAKRDKTTVSFQFDIAIKRYEEFIEDLIDSGYKNIIIYSVPLPTIKKSQKKGFVSDLRKDAKIGIRERTSITIKFNKTIKTYCQRSGIRFLSIYDKILNTKTGVINRKYINPDRLDHHLYISAVEPLITKELKIFGYK